MNLSNHKILKILTIISGLLLLLGIFLPTLEIKKFFIFNDTYSIFSFTIELFIKKEFLLFLLIFLFSICFPFFKIFVLFQKLNGKTIAPWVIQLGKWSLAEVFLAALIVFSVKAGGVASAVTLPGLYFFTSSIALTAWIAVKTKNNNM